MSIFRLLFPVQSREFPHQRWTSIVLRTLHLLGVAGMGGGFLYPAPLEEWLAYMYLTMASGLALFLVEIWSNGICLIQLRGLAIMLKIFILAMVPLFPQHALYMVVVTLVISGLISHAPGDVRYYSLYHGRRIEHL